MSNLNWGPEWERSIETMLETEREALADELLALGLTPADMLAAQRRSEVGLPDVPMSYKYHVVYFYTVHAGERSTVDSYSWATRHVERSVPIDKNFLQVELVRQFLASLVKGELQKVHPEIDRVKLVLIDWHLLGE